MKKCQLCNKSKKIIIKRKKLRGKYNPVKKTWQKANLQWFKINSRRILVCSNCRRLILKGKVSLSTLKDLRKSK